MKGSVMLANVNDGTLTLDFVRSLFALLDHDRSGPMRLCGDPLFVQAGPALTGARNAIVQQFLASQATWLLQVDSDMGFPADALDALTEAVGERKILGAACALAPDAIGPRPNTYWWTAVPRRPRQLVPRLPPAGSPNPVECDGTGAAFLMVHRDVFAKLLAVCDGTHPAWFGEATVNGWVLSEDLGFCWRAAQQGFPTWVLHGLDVTHRKSTALQPPRW